MLRPPFEGLVLREFQAMLREVERQARQSEVARQLMRLGHILACLIASAAQLLVVPSMPETILACVGSLYFRGVQS